MSIIYYTKFTSDPWGNGAEKRTSQIKYLLDQIDVPIIDFTRQTQSIPVSRFQMYKNGLMYLLSHRIPTITKLKAAHNGLEISRNQLFFSTNRKSKAVIWESSRYSDPKIPIASKKVNIPVIGLPHNLESLVPFQKSFLTKKEGIYWLDEEINTLKQCDLIFTISKEEEWLLTLLGLNAKHLPYYPIPIVEEHLLEIREKRKSSNKDYFLLLGTVLNPPTRQGFIDIISYFDKHHKGLKLKVAGFATESLKDEINLNDNKVELIGTVDNRQLEELLVNCKAMIVNQLPSSGALTKIQEMRIAGVPIIANNLSLRSYYNITGLYVFDDFKELELIIDNDKYLSPEIPTREINADNRLLNSIKEYLN